MRSNHCAVSSEANQIRNTDSSLIGPKSCSFAELVCLLEAVESRSGERTWPKSMRLPCTFLVCLVAGTLISGTPAFAQPKAPAARIISIIDEGQSVTLKGNTPAAANAQNDRGPVSPGLPMTDLVLVLSRSSQQQASLDEFVSSQYDPTSPSFHHWISPVEVGETYGPSLSDIATISNWLAGHGFLVNEVAKDHMSIRFSGTAVQVEKTFHTAIDNLLVNGKMHIGNMTDPQIPSALAGVVTGVKALHNFLPRPQHRLGKKVRFDPSKGVWQSADTAAAPAVKPGPVAAVEAHPEFGINIGSGSSAETIEDVAPYDFATIYNVLPLWNSNIVGTGQTIAIAGTSDINTADVAQFRSIFGLPAGIAPQTIIANGIDPGQCTSTNPYASCTIDDLVENTLDVEWSGAVARGASIVLVVSGSSSATTDTVYTSAEYVIQNNTANILNVSYGECELDMGTSDNAAYNNLWETAATEGIAIFVASGDSGSATCDQAGDANPPDEAQYGLSVSGLASTPYNTAVGGTDFNWGSKASPYWGTSNNSGNGSNALGYVPEVPWNDTCTNPLALNYLQQWAAALQKAGYGAVSPTDAESGCGFVNAWWALIYNNTSPQVNISGFLSTVGGGGGASNCTTSDGATVASCTGGYPKPSWQTGVIGIPADGKRDLPDVSFLAGNGFLGSAYLICVSAEGACITSTTLTTNPVAQEVGGTSVASPAMAGIMALINQKAGADQGNPNPELYLLASKQTYANCSAETARTNNGCYFNDPDKGTNAMACALGSPDCTVIHSGDLVGILSGFGATAGFDPATGLGSLNVANVVDNWTSTIGTTKTTLTVVPAQNSLVLSQSLSVTINVSGAGGTPSGNVALVGGGYLSGAGTLSAGAYTFTIPASTLPAGNITLTATYAGDSTYAETKGTATVAVSKVTPNVTVHATPSSIGANTAVNVTVSVTGAGLTSTGTIQLSGEGYTSATCTLTGGVCTFTIPVNTLSNGTDTLTASYSGDNHYLAANGTATETVNALTPVVKVTSSLTSLDTVTALQVTVSVTGSGATPTGNVWLYGILGGTVGNGYDLYCTLSGGTCNFTVQPGNLYSGTETLTGVYSGDSSYLPVNGTTQVVVSKATPSLTVVPSASSIYTNNSLILTGTISSPAEIPTGYITVTGGGYTGYATPSGPSIYLVIPPGSLAVGTDTLTIAYGGDRFFNSTTTSTTISVAQFIPIPSAVTLTPASSSVGSGQSLDVVVVVTGTQGAPTGTVTLTSGSYNSGAWPMSGGGATVHIQPNALNIGSDTLTASYSGDPTYLPSSATAAVSVTQSDFTLTASNAPSILPGGITQSSITVSSTTGYTGTITMACTLTGQPAGATDLPNCAMLNPTVELPTAAAIADADITTTASTAAFARPAPPVKGNGWMGVGGGTALAFLVYLGVPVRRRKWRSMLGLLVLLAALGGLGACGSGGGSSGSGGGAGNTGTTPGTYTFTVTGTGNPALTPAPTVIFTVTVT